MAQRRMTKTKRAIKQAFTELITEKGIDRLSVTDVARRAGVNRGTVYLHYTDKYDLLHKLENETLEELGGILFKEGEPVTDPRDLVTNTAVLDALRFVQADAAFFTALTGPGGDPEFVEEFKRVIGRHLFAEVERSSTLSVRLHDMPLPYAREIALGSIVAVISLWLRNGATDPVELVARVIDTAKRTAPLDLLE